MSETIGAPQPVLMGQVVAVFGIKGWVKIHSHTQPKEAILSYSALLLEQDSATGQRKGQKPRQDWLPVKLLSGQPKGKGLIAHFEGFDDRDAAQTLIGKQIAIQAGQLPTLAEDEVYWHQLEGLEVRLSESSEYWSDYASQTGSDEQASRVVLGRVDYLIATGANDVLVVKPTSQSLDKQERLLPYIKQTVLSVDLEQGCLWVDWDPAF